MSSLSTLSSVHFAQEIFSTSGVGMITLGSMTAVVFAGATVVVVVSADVVVRGMVVGATVVVGRGVVLVAATSVVGGDESELELHAASVSVRITAAADRRPLCIAAAR